MAQSRDQAVDTLRAAIHTAFDAGVTPTDVELIVATIYAGPLPKPRGVELDGNAGKVYRIITARIDAEGMCEIRLKQEVLALELGIALKTVRRAVAQIRTYGALIVTNRGASTGFALPSSHQYSEKSTLASKVISTPVRDQGPDVCPIHAGDVTKETTLRSLLPVLRRNGERVFYCVGDRGNCSWRYGTVVGVYVPAGQEQPDHNIDYNAYLKARQEMGLEPGGKPWFAKQNR